MTLLQLSPLAGRFSDVEASLLLQVVVRSLHDQTVEWTFYWQER